MENPHPAPRAPVQIESISLLEVEFKRAEIIPDGPREFEGDFQLTATDPEDDRMRADLIVTVAGDEESWRVRVHYVVVFHRTEPFEEDADEAAFWEAVGEQVAPMIMYPYVRETVTTLMTKAGLPPVIPPILDFSRAERADPDTQEEFDLES